MPNKFDGDQLKLWNVTSYKIIGAAFKVHSNLGPGLLESAYEACMEIELVKLNFNVKRQVELPIHYDGKILDTKYRIDMVINDAILLELKAVHELLPIHKAQAMTYMKLANIKLGLLINFNTTDLKEGIKRIML